MSLAWARNQYRVPAALFVRVVANGQPGTIVGDMGPHLAIKIDTDREPTPWHPTWQMLYQAAHPDAAAFLADVDAGHLYFVNQRSSKYAMNRRTYRRCTREAKRYASAGLIALTGSTNGSATDYALTEEGVATLAAYRSLTADGPVDRTGDPGTRGGLTISTKGPAPR